VRRAGACRVIGINVIPSLFTMAGGKRTQRAECLSARVQVSAKNSGMRLTVGERLAGAGFNNPPRRVASAALWGELKDLAT
jgi:hypothetical protein